MCNRFRSIEEWSEIPRTLHSGPRLTFAFNPNVAPTELVPILVAEPDGPSKPVIARFGINLPCAAADLRSAIFRMVSSGRGTCAVAAGRAPASGL